MTETSALKKLQLGSSDALNWFVKKYSAYVSTVIHNIIGQTMGNSDVEEVAADVFYTLWKNAEKVNESSVKGYLGCVARNKAKNKLRETGHSFTYEDEFNITEEMSLEDQCLEAELKTAVKTAVASMKEPEREIVLRYYYYCQSVSTISQEMRLSASNVKIKLHRARKVLKAMLERYFLD